MSEQVFTAAEAKQMVEDSSGMFDEIMTQIRREAKNNRSICTWGFYGCTDETINKIIQQVKDVGYTINVKADDNGNPTKEYEITW